MTSVLNGLFGTAIIIGATGLTGYAIDKSCYWSGCKIVNHNSAIMILTTVGISVSYFVTRTLWAN